MSRDALVIGINLYGELQPLDKPANDAEAIAQLLETQGGFRVKRLPTLDEKSIDDSSVVTFEQLKKAITDIFTSESNNPSETVLLFFAGHNLPEGLAVSNTIPDDSQTIITFQWLAELLQNSPVKQQIIWVDACYSGHFIDCLQPSNSHDRCVITSARAHEEALDSGVLAEILKETLDYKQQPSDSPWVNSDILVRLVGYKNQTSEGWQRFRFEHSGNPIVLTNQAFERNIKTDICPYKGLHYFDNNPDDARYFKGRTALIDELKTKVQNNNFLAVLGASGHGKSSIVRAGLVYQLRQTQRWHILPIITPTTNPLNKLQEITNYPVNQLFEFVNQDENERVMLVVDQFEEVFTLCKDKQERKQFFDILLAETQRPDNKFCLMIVMRADFLAECANYKKLVQTISDHQVIITPMSSEELEESIREPIQQVQWNIEAKLVSEMLADVKESEGSLPLLQYTLKALWEACHSQKLLIFSAYEQLGKIAGTLEKTANEVYASLSTQEQQVAQRIFIELTQPIEDRYVGRKVSIEQLENLSVDNRTHIRPVLQKLVNANLLVSGGDKAGKVSLAHEALIQHWKSLRKWLDEHKQFEEDRRVKRQRNIRIAVFSIVFVIISIFVSLWFYANSQKVEADNQRAEAEEQTKQTLIRQLGNQALLTMQKPDKINAFPDTALLLATQALQFDLSNITAQSNLLNILQMSHMSKFFNWEEHREYDFDLYNQVYVDFDANNERILTTKSSGLLAIWDVKSGKILGKPWNVGENTRGVVAAWSPNGKTILTSANGQLKLWNVDSQQLSGKPWKKFQGHITSMAFSPSGQLVVTGGEDGIVGSSIVVWDVKNSRPIHLSLDKYQSSTVTNISFSVDGRYMTSSVDKKLTVWDVKGHTFKKKWDRFHKGSITRTRFSSTGSYIVSAGEDETILWHVKTGQKMKALEHKMHNVSYIQDLAFISSDKYIMAGDYDKTLFWKVGKRQGQQEVNIVNLWENPPSPNMAATWVTYSSDGKYIIGNSSMNTFIRWNTNFNNEYPNIFIPWRIENPIEINGDWQKYQSLDDSNMVTVSADSKYAIGLDGNTLNVWDIKSNVRKKVILEGNTIQYRKGIAISHDKQYIAIELI